MSKRALAVLAMITLIAPGAMTVFAAETADEAETAEPEAGAADPQGNPAKSSSSKTSSAKALPAGYDKGALNGFFIRTEDDSFRLNIGAYTQPRYDVNWRDAPPGGDDVTSDFSVNRTRIFFEGKYTPEFNYHLRIQIDGEGDVSLLIAYMQYNFGKNKRWALRGGRQFVGTSREDWQFAQDVLTTDYSANDDTFAIGTSDAAQIIFTGDRHRFWAAIGNGAYGGKREFPDNEPSDIAFTGRWEYQLSGKDWSNWDDMIGRRGRSRGILFGIGAGYEDKETSTTDPIESGAQLNLDISFNGSGFQAMVAGSMTFPDPLLGDSYYNYGVLVQGGYFFTKKLQVYGQYNLVSAGDQPGNIEDFNSISAGVNYLPFEWTNRWKFSGEVAYLADAINNTLVGPSGGLGWLASDEDGQTYFRIQAQFGF